MGAMGACEQAGVDGNTAVVPCVHAFGLADLARLYTRDVRYLVITSGDCTGCARGNGPRLWDTVEELNSMFKGRGMEEIVLDRVPPSKWSGVLNTYNNYAPGRSLSRRRFFTRLVRANGQKGAETTPLEDNQRQVFLPLGAVFPSRKDDAIVPFLPWIDQERCNGCDGCVRLCPHGVITLKEEAGTSAYHLGPDSCTGCGLCVDICDQDAVKVERWRPQEQISLPLSSMRCRVCGTPHHLPAIRKNKEDLCRICVEKDRSHNRLFQVLS